ncbi:MAG: glycosyltransferase [Peptococcaceae bacterium]|nr:MAG: glycosyltransferase [Peptococcaceae bacterium]
MFAAVIPARNEAPQLEKVIRTLLSLPVDLIIPVINGCTDNSLEKVKKNLHPQIVLVHYKEALGIDIPRAIGAKLAFDRGAGGVLFLDGDMSGDIAENLRGLLDPIIRKEADLTLTDCYPETHPRELSFLARYLLKIRREFNKEAGLLKTIGAASPSHGPHAVSRRLLRVIPFRELAIPPATLALVARQRLAVAVGATIPHKTLGSPEKNPKHARLVAETIIGDYLEAFCLYRGEKRSRSDGQKEYIGYHLERRWDLLEEFCSASSD